MTRRTASDLLCLLAVLAAIAAGAGWWVSHRRTLELDYYAYRWMGGVSLTVGQLGFWTTVDGGSAARMRGWRWSDTSRVDFDSTPFTKQSFDLHALRFRLVHEPLSPAGSGHYVLLQLPLWLVSPVLALLSSLFVHRRVRARRRVGANLCSQCGYDLRATPDRCPECGTVPPAVPAVHPPS
jgi:hypothetical protein